MGYLHGFMRVRADVVVNLRLVTDVWREPNGDVTVCLAAPAAEGRGSSDWVTDCRGLTLKGADASAFWNYLVARTACTRPFDPKGGD